MCFIYCDNVNCVMQVHSLLTYYVCVVYVILCVVECPVCSLMIINQVHVLCSLQMHL